MRSDLAGPGDAAARTTAAARRLGALTRRAALRGAGALMLAGAGVALLAGTAARSAGVALLIGGALALALALIARSDRRRLLVALIAEGQAPALPEVQRRAEALVGPRERRRLAHSLRAAAGQGGPGGANAPLMVDGARAADVAPRLRRLADAIAEPRRPPEPAALALCVQMLTEPRRSPLCNPRVPVAELEVLLARLERGIAPDAPDGELATRTAATS